MAFSRVAALRSSLRSTRSSTFSRPQLWRQAARRGYASGGHAKSAGGDAVWAAGAVAVTVPTCWYLLQNGPAGHHDDPHHDSDNSHHGVKEKDTSKDDGEESDEGKEPKAEEADSKPDDEKTTDDKESKSDDKEDKSDDSDKSEDDKEDAEKKGDDKETKKSDSEDSDASSSSDSQGHDSHSVGETDQNRVKSIPDAKGGNKKRLESKASIPQGDAADSYTTQDTPAPAKESGGKGTQSGKQEGLSNTDTKHSTDIAGNPEKSTKAEGGPDTAKVKGTIDPKRPQK